MDVGGLLDSLVKLLPVAKTVLAVMGCLVVLMTAVVKLTPSQEDDALLVKLKGIPVLGALIEALERFSLFSRKE